MVPSDVSVVRSSAKLLRLVQTLKCGGTKSWSQNFALFLSTKIQGPLLIEHKYISVPYFVCYDMLHFCFPVRGPMFINMALMGYDALCKLIVAFGKLNYPRPFIITVNCRSPQALWINRLCLLPNNNAFRRFSWIDRIHIPGPFHSDAGCSLRTQLGCKSFPVQAWTGP